VLRRCEHHNVTSVAFHLPVADKLAYTCRLLRKAVTRGSRLVVTGAPDTLAQLDLALWTFSATEFVPHCQADAVDGVLRRSAVVLAETPAVIDALPGILINLGSQVPEGFERFERVIEVVTGDDDDRQWARQRWKHYTQAGFPPVKFDMDQRTTA
jgi:DNA polymerase-3 subunit chi